MLIVKNKFDYGRNLKTAKFMRNKKIKKSFTLIELVVVLGIMVLVGGIVFVSVGKKPTFVVIDDVTASIEAVLQQGAMQALAQGKQTKVIYDPESKTVSVSSPSESSTVFGMEKNIKKFYSYTIPDDVAIECQSLFDNELPSFIFFPDGTAFGPEMIASYKGHSFVISVSPLTGMVNRNYIND